MKSILITAALAVSLLLPATAISEDDGTSTVPVWRMVYYRFLPGQAGAFWADFNEVFIPVSKIIMERDLVKSWRVLENPYKNSPDDWDAMLMLEYANYSALDRFYAEAMAVYAEVYPDPEEVREMFARRDKYREVVRVDLVTERKF